MNNTPSFFDSTITLWGPNPRDPSVDKGMQHLWGRVISMIPVGLIYYLQDKSCEWNPMLATAMLLVVISNAWLTNNALWTTMVATNARCMLSLHLWRERPTEASCETPLSSLLLTLTTVAILSRYLYQACQPPQAAAQEATAAETKKTI